MLGQRSGHVSGSRIVRLHALGFAAGSGVVRLVAPIKAGGVGSLALEVVMLAWLTRGTHVGLYIG